MLSTFSKSGEFIAYAYFQLIQGKTCNGILTMFSWKNEKESVTWLDLKTSPEMMDLFLTTTGLKISFLIL